MSATEKLERMNDARLECPACAEYSQGSFVVLSDAAFGHIVELVQWAEKFAEFNDYHAWTNKEHPRLEPELDAALAALKESLP